MPNFLHIPLATASCSARRLLFLAAFFVLGALPSIVRADVLDNVLESGVLRVAVVLDYPPFGSVGADFKPQGYDIEFARLVAKSMGVKAKLISVTSPAKIPSIQAGKADLLLNIGRTEERAKVVDFSDAYAPYYIGIFGPAGIKVTDAADLAGRTISVTCGSFEEQLLTKVAPPTADIRCFEDNAGTISAFLSGQTDLMSVGNIVAAALLAKNPRRRPEQKFLLLDSPVRAAVKKGETRLLERVNEAISAAKKDGTLARMSQHWLKQPFPKNL